MIRIGRFEEEWESLKKDCESGSFIYSEPSASASKIVRSHFRNIRQQEKHGVYVVRQQASREVLYIGKSGTIEQNGSFKGQDIPGRLTNLKGNITANQWFKTLVREKGPLTIEYVFLTSVPKSPALVEAVLLQAYLNERSCLPYRNKAF
jgi:hypothetical protein